MVRDLARKIVNQFWLEKSYINEVFHFWRLTVKFNASNYTDRDIEKMQYTILRENHTIEKGMSMRNPRKGFGQEKVKHLLQRLMAYKERYFEANPDFMIYPLSTISNYIRYTEEHGTNIPAIKKDYDELVNATGLEIKNVASGIHKETRKHIQELCDKNFESLLYSRHSLRYFTRNEPSREIIDKALTLAQRTPSACNRQSWKTHVYTGEDSVSLIKWQGGSRGFEDEIKLSILVTANMKAFLSYEIHQMYVDGGLYAMNLINALHSLGLGTIPLSTAFDYRKLKGLSEFDVPENEIPILIIGVGELLEEFNCAVSSRKEIIETNTYHNVMFNKSLENDSSQMGGGKSFLLIAKTNTSCQMCA